MKGMWTQVRQMGRDVNKASQWRDMGRSTKAPKELKEVHWWWSTMLGWQGGLGWGTDFEVKDEEGEVSRSQILSEERKESEHPLGNN